MAITISSPHQEFTFPNGNEGAIVKLPVFSAKDSIGGTISVNPAAYPNSSNAKIIVSVRLPLGVSCHDVFLISPIMTATTHYYLLYDHLIIHSSSGRLSISA